MKPYKLIYMKHYNYGIDDLILCESCGAVAVDIHHIDRKGMGGSKLKDHISNLIALCRGCHTRAHSSVEFNIKLKERKQNGFRNC